MPDYVLPDFLVGAVWRFYLRKCRGIKIPKTTALLVRLDNDYFWLFGGDINGIDPWPDWRRLVNPHCADFSLLLQNAGISGNNLFLVDRRSYCIFGAIGSLTGLVGVGGGFLIVPTLINLFALDAKKAIGTSLVVITANSFIGFKSDVIFGEKLDWLMLLSLCLATLIGMIAGIFLSKKIDSSSLKKIFAYFVILVAILIFTQTLKQILAL